MAAVDDSKTQKASVDDSERPESLLDRASWFSNWVYTWPFETLKLGLTKTLTPNDLPKLSHQDKSVSLTNHFEGKWRDELKQKAKPSFRRVLLKDYWDFSLFLQPLLITEEACLIAQSILLGSLITSFSEFNDAQKNNLPTDAKKGFVIAGGMILCALGALLAHHKYFFLTWRKGMQLKTGSIGLIFRKVLRLNFGVTSEANGGGKVINLATNDVERYMLASIFLPYLFYSPLEAIVVLFIGMKYVGRSFAVGWVILMMAVPLQWWLSKRFAQVRSTVAQITDKRVQLVGQAVEGCRVMKMSGWENKFSRKIDEIRSLEVLQIQKSNRLRSANEAIFFVVNVTIVLVTFTAHVEIFDEPITPTIVFTCLTLINILQFRMTKFFSLGIMGASEVLVSISRIQAFLEYEDFVDTTKTMAVEGEEGADGGDAVRFVDYTAAWSASDKAVIALNKVNVVFERNQLHCIIGPVGSGKSAFLYSILSELCVVEGRVDIGLGSEIGYASQKPFITSGTLRENITLGKEIADKEFYDRVIKSVGLNIDVETLKNGDQTIIGDRGVNLSGGQRARIGLARMLYSRPNVILLDDVLSAVDVKVGKIIFYDAIVGIALKELKATILLVTHQHNFCSDPVVKSNTLLVEGKIVWKGSYDECAEKSEGKINAKLSDSESDVETSGAARTRTRTRTRSRNRSVGSGGELDAESIDVEFDENDDVNEEASLTTTKKNSCDDDNENSSSDAKAHKEDQESGVVKLSTLKAYMSSMGPWWATATVGVEMLAGQVFIVLSVYHLGEWADMPFEEQKERSNILKVWVYVIISIVLSFLRTYTTFYYFIKSAQNLHNSMTRTVLRAKVSFFDTNPVGRILNRFSADVGITDDQLPSTLYDFIMCGLMCLAAITTASIVLPSTLICIPFLFFYFRSLRKTYLKSSREIKRIESVTRSPIFIMLREALNGLPTIRSLSGASSVFLEKFSRLQDENTSAMFAFIASARWLGIRLDFISFVVLCFATVAAVVFHQHVDAVTIDPATLGLALSYLLQLAGLFQWAVRQSAETENFFVSVERIVQYTNLPLEDELKKALDDADELLNWPKGGIEFKDVSARYRTGLEQSLKGVNLSIKPGERVGIVGRTGSGKSTLLQCLFRILDEVDGSISIDGVDTRDLGLHRLRGSIGVIPQEPTLFNSTLRDNLDPFSHYSDSEIHSALECVQMSEAASAVGLSHMLTSGGGNFSVGQRQLLCLARAILRRCRVLVLDEPTANVDEVTDGRLQKAVKEVFGSSTIIAVAHRLETIIDYDRIVVMAEGRVVETGTAKELLGRKGGAFEGMVREVGGEGEKLLRRRAAGVSE